MKKLTLKPKAKGKRITVFFTGETLAAIAVIAKQSGVNRNQVINELVRVGATEVLAEANRARGWLCSSDGCEPFIGRGSDET